MTSILVSSLSRRAMSACNSRFATTSAVAMTTRPLARRTFVSRTMPLADDDLPYHVVQGMPALSPTMDSGTLSEWYVKEGDSFIAGDSLAKIETDKATMDFEAQDDGYVAKILVEAGAEEIPVGKPIMVTVEEEEDVAAFANYSPPEEATAPAPSNKEEEEAPKAAESSPAPSQGEEEPKAAESSPAPSQEEEVPKAAESTPPPPQQETRPPPPSLAQSGAPTSTSAPSSGWGSLAFVNSPIVKTLRKKQKAYIETYGTTGQAPL